MNLKGCKITAVIIILMLHCFPCQSQTGTYDNAKKFTTEEIKSDFRYLKQKLEKKHPNLYLYTSKEKLQFIFDSLYREFRQPMTEREFYHHLAILHSILKDGHTMLLPSNGAIEYYNNDCRFFPFFVYVTNHTIQVFQNCSSNDTIKEGVTITSINGVPAQKIVQDLLSRCVRDGENETYPRWILTQYFKEYYSFSFGHPNTYTVTYKEGTLDEQTATIDALPKDSILYFKKSRYPTSVNKSESGKGISLGFSENHSAAILQIKSFDTHLLKSQYNQNFSTSIQKAFLQIQQKNIENLIIDLRNNQGGDFGTGRELLSYLIKNPIVYLEGSKQERQINPARRAFQNNLYVLINGGSFSNSGIVSAYLSLEGRAQFFGEEAGGNCTILSGEPIDFILPNTGLNCQVSTQSFVITTKHRESHGLQPNIFIEPDIASLIAGKDVILEAVFKQITDRKAVH